MEDEKLQGEGPVVDDPGCSLQEASAEIEVQAGAPVDAGEIQQPDPIAAPEQGDGASSAVPEGEPVAAALPVGAEAPVEAAQEAAPAIADAVMAVSGKADAILASFDRLNADVRALQKAVSGYYTTNTDSMHREIEKFRKGLVRKMEQELFGELIELYDSASSAVARAKEDQSCAMPLLEGLRDQIDASLFNRGVERRDAAQGEKFDPRRHHVARPDVPTGDKSLDGLVAATAKSGFDDIDESFSSLRGGCMKLRPIWVRLYRYDEALSNPADVAPQASDALAENGPSEDQQ